MVLGRTRVPSTYLSSLQLSHAIHRVADLIVTDFSVRLASGDRYR